MAEQWRLLGVDPEKAKQLQPHPDSLAADVADDGVNVELDFESWQAWRVFLLCLSSWRIVCGVGGIFYQGMDPTAMVANAQMLGIKPKHWPDLRWRLSFLELEANIHLNSQV